MDLILPGCRRMIRFMRRILLRWGVLITLALILCGHVTELFDRWDHTMATGSDVDYSIVLLAASAGLAVVVARHLASLTGSSKEPQGSTADNSFLSLPSTVCVGPDLDISPPPLLPLRI